MILSGCQLRGLHQHTLDMFVALFGKRGAHHLVGRALFITAEPAVTDGFSDRGETRNLSHFQCPGQRRAIQSTCGRCEWCQRGRRMFCPYMKGTGIEAQGGHAEYMPMNADATYLIPDKVSYEQAAPIFCAGYTVYSGLRCADLQPHERVAVLGSGGLGH